MDSNRPVLETRAQSRDKGVPLVDFLQRHFRGASKTAMKMVIRLDGVWLNHILIRNPGHVLRGEESVLIVESSLPLNSNRRRGEEQDDSPFRDWIIHEDQSVLSINKPAGISAQSEPNRQGRNELDLMKAARSYCQKRGNQKNLNLNMVHRIDRNTSGIVLFAKTNDANRKLTQAFRSNNVRKQYLVIVKGAPPANSGTLVHFIRKDAKQNKAELRDTEGGQDWRKAILKYQIRSRFPLASVLRIDMETDHSHQVRCQLAAIGCPILGDNKYGGVLDDTFPSDLMPANRMALHFHRMSFHHPANNRMFHLEANLAPDLKSLIDRLGVAETIRDTPVD